MIFETYIILAIKLCLLNNEYNLTMNSDFFLYIILYYYLFCTIPWNRWCLVTNAKHFKYKTKKKKHYIFFFD